MKIKVNKIIQNVYGEPIKSIRKKPGAIIDENDIESVKKGREDLTLREVMVNALLGDYQDEKGLQGTEKLSRYKLAMKVQSTKIELELKSGDIVLIKDLVAKAWNPLVCGQAFEMIEP